MSRPSTYTHTFQLPAAPGVVFELMADPRKLDRLTPSWFRLVPRGDVPAELEVGSLVSYRFRWRGMPLPWTSRITDWEPGRFFAYEQERGPYRFFRHEHFFAPAGDGTEICDHVIFRAPGGAIAERLIAGPDLRRIFAGRERRARDLLEERQEEAPSGPPASRIPRTSASSSAIERPT